RSRSAGSPSAATPSPPATPPRARTTGASAPPSRSSSPATPAACQVAAAAPPAADPARWSGSRSPAWSRSRSGGAADPSARAIDRYHAASPDSAWFVLDSATFAGEREVAIALVSEYEREPLSIYDSDGGVRARGVRDALIGHL